MLPTWCWDWDPEDWNPVGDSLGRRAPSLQRHKSRVQIPTLPGCGFLGKSLNF